MKKKAEDKKLGTSKLSIQNDLIESLCKFSGEDLQRNYGISAKTPTSVDFETKIADSTALGMPDFHGNVHTFKYYHRCSGRYSKCCCTSPTTFWSGRFLKKFAGGLVSCSRQRLCSQLVALSQFGCKAGGECLVRPCELDFQTVIPGCLCSSTLCFSRHLRANDGAGDIDLLQQTNTAVR